MKMPITIYIRYRNNNQIKFWLGLIGIEPCQYNNKKKTMCMAIGVAKAKIYIKKRREEKALIFPVILSLKSMMNASCLKGERERNTEKEKKKSKFLSHKIRESSAPNAYTAARHQTQAKPAYVYTHARSQELFKALSGRQIRASSSGSRWNSTSPREGLPRKSLYFVIAY